MQQSEGLRGKGATDELVCSGVLAPCNSFALFSEETLQKKLQKKKKEKKTSKTGEKKKFMR